MIENMVEEAWPTFDILKRGELDKYQTKMFIQTRIYSGADYPEATFNKVFEDMDADGNGFVDKDEMKEFIKKLLSECDEDPQPDQ